MKLKRFKQINEEVNVTENDKIGGISYQEYNQIIDFVGDLRKKSSTKTTNDEENILSEILYMIITKKKSDFDYNTYYNRRLEFIKRNKNKKSTEEIDRFKELVWWIQDSYAWEHVECEGYNHVKFDWLNGSFLLYDNGTLEGSIPEELKKKFMEKGIEIKKQWIKF